MGSNFLYLILKSLFLKFALCPWSSSDRCWHIVKSAWSEKKSWVIVAVLQGHNKETETHRHKNTNKIPPIQVLWWEIKVRINSFYFLLHFFAYLARLIQNQSYFVLVIGLIIISVNLLGHWILNLVVLRNRVLKDNRSSACLGHFILDI